MKEVKYPGARGAAYGQFTRTNSSYGLWVELISLISLGIAGCPEKNFSSTLNITEKHNFWHNFQCFLKRYKLLVTGTNVSGLLWWLSGKELPANAGDLKVPRSGRSPGGGHGYPLQRSCLENLHGQRSLVGHSPWGLKELDTTGQLNNNNSNNRL